MQPADLFAYEAHAFYTMRPNCFAFIYLCSVMSSVLDVFVCNCGPVQFIMPISCSTMQVFNYFFLVLFLTGAEGIVAADLVQTLVNKLKNELDEIKVKRHSNTECGGDCNDRPLKGEEFVL